MSDPITLPSSTPALGLPLLIAGQAQKEFFVNQAICVLDALNAHVVTASLGVPPASPAEGACFRIVTPAAGAWSGQADSLAILAGGAWHFIAPIAGMQIFDQQAGHQLVFRAGWKHADAPAAPAGGSVVDTEARSAIGALIQSLVAVGMLAPDSV